MIKIIFLSILAIIILYLKGNYQRFFHDDVDPLVGHKSRIHKGRPKNFKPFIGYMTARGNENGKNI